MKSTTQELSSKHRELLQAPTVRPSALSASEGDSAGCLTCERRCSIPLEGVGFCQTRMNIDGKIYTLVYGDISSISVNPIEKKPFFHFWPGSRALTIGSWGCNYSCLWCQNFEISKTAPNPRTARYTSPEDLARMTSSTNSQGVSISFNEPTLLLEYALDLFPLVKRLCLNTSYVSNGYMTTAALHKLKDAGLDAIKFDIKGDAEVVRKYCNADANVVWRNVKEAKRLGMHVEVVVLLIPDVNDGPSAVKEIIKSHLDYAGPDVPLHFTRFHPDYQMRDREPTPLETLERAYSIAKKEGIEYIYLGNCPGHKFENTYCPGCGELLIKRHIFDIVDCRLGEDSSCPACGQKIPITGTPMMGLQS